VVDDGTFGHGEFFGDGSVGSALGDQGEHGGFPGGQGTQAVVVAAMARAAVASWAKATGRERGPGDHDLRYITIPPYRSNRDSDRRARPRSSRGRTWVYRRRVPAAS
jgi:hypothetical protein